MFATRADSPPFVRGGRGGPAKGSDAILADLRSARVRTVISHPQVSSHFRRPAVVRRGSVRRPAATTGDRRQRDDSSLPIELSHLHRRRLTELLSPLGGFG